MRDRRVCFVLIALALLFSANASAAPVVINGSFERRDFAGWTLSIDMYFSHVTIGDDGQETYTRIHAEDLPFSIFEEFPFTKPKIETHGHYDPRHGHSYLLLPGHLGGASWSEPADPEYFEKYRAYEPITSNACNVCGMGTLTASQQLSLDVGDVVSGWAAFRTTDYPPYIADRAFVQISNSAVSDRPLEITVRDVYGDLWSSPSASAPQMSPWTYWAWTAPSAGVYTLSLNNLMDDQEDSIAVFDGIRVRHAVAEPSTLQLIGPALVLLIGLVGTRTLQG